jgi:hypothetical protein
MRENIILDNWTEGAVNRNSEPEVARRSDLHIHVDFNVFFPLKF